MAAIPVLLDIGMLPDLVSIPDIPAISDIVAVAMSVIIDIADSDIAPIPPILMCIVLVGEIVNVPVMLLISIPFMVFIPAIWFIVEVPSIFSSKELLYIRHSTRKLQVKQLTAGPNKFKQTREYCSTLSYCFEKMSKY